MNQFLHLIPHNHRTTVTAILKNKFFGNLIPASITPTISIRIYVLKCSSQHEQLNVSPISNGHRKHTSWVVAIFLSAPTVFKKIFELVAGEVFVFRVWFGS